MSAKGSGTPRRRGPVAWWKIATGAAAGMMVIDLAQATRGIASFVVLAAGFAVLGLAGWLWGSDSRDGADWRRTPDPARR